MSWLGTLAKVGLLGAAPFTGGATLAALPAADLLDKVGGASAAAGSVMGAQQGGANNARIAQGQLDSGQNRNNIDLYQAQNQAQQQQALTDLQRQQFTSNNRSSTAKQALIGALLGGGVTPTSVGPNGASGGLVRSLNANPEALAAMKTLGSQGATAQATPLSFQGGQPVAAPKMIDMPKVDIGDGPMGTLSKILQIFGAVSPYLHKPGDDS